MEKLQEILFKSGVFLMSHPKTAMFIVGGVLGFLIGFIL
jgi:hypothetical protein